MSHWLWCGAMTSSVSALSFGLGQTGISQMPSTLSTRTVQECARYVNPVWGQMYKVKVLWWVSNCSFYVVSIMMWLASPVFILNVPDFNDEGSKRSVGMNHQGNSYPVSIKSFLLHCIANGILGCPPFVSISTPKVARELCGQVIRVMGSVVSVGPLFLPHFC